MDLLKSWRLLLPAVVAVAAMIGVIGYASSDGSGRSCASGNVSGLRVSMQGVYGKGGSPGREGPLKSGDTGSSSKRLGSKERPRLLDLGSHEKVRFEGAVENDQ